MCKLVIGIAKNKKGAEEVRNILIAQESTLMLEDDGIGAILVNKKKELNIFRSVKNYQRTFERIYDNLDEAKIVSVHTRTKTTGEVAKKNVHFFNSGNYLFAHNGTVPKYSSYGFTTGNYNSPSATYSFDFSSPENKKKEARYYEILDRIYKCNLCDTNNQIYCTPHLAIAKEGDKLETELYNPTPKKIEEETKVAPSDSLQFIRNIPKPITQEVLEKEIESTNFWGLAYVIETKTKESFLIVQKDSYVVTDNKNFAVFFSYKPEMELENLIYGRTFGIDYLDRKEEIKLPYEPKEIERGIYKFDLQEVLQNTKK